MSTFHFNNLKTTTLTLSNQDTNNLYTQTGGITLYTLVGKNADTLYANPVNGGRIIIDNKPRQFTGFKTVSTLGNNPNTIYYVYAYWTGSDIALELSTTHYTFSYNFPHPGIPYKANDSSRALVGMVYLNSESKIDNNAQNNSILNYYNRILSFLAGQADAFSPFASAVDANIPWEDAYEYIATISSQYARWDSNAPTSGANFQEIGTTTDNKIQFLSWGRGGLTSNLRNPAIIMGISGGGWVSRKGQRVVIEFGTTGRGPSLPISSWMPATAPVANTSFNASGASTIGSIGSQYATLTAGIYGDGRHEFNVWAQMVTQPIGVSAFSSNSTLTASPIDHDFTTNEKVMFVTLTGGGPLQTLTPYYVRDISGNTFKISTSPGSTAISLTANLVRGQIEAIGTATIAVNSFCSYYG